MKALSIQQPWAYCITNGKKRVENRTWPTPFRGRFLVHAGKKTDGNPEEWRDWFLDEDFRAPGLQRVPLGMIVGVATLVACVPPEHVATEQRSWAMGPWCFVLENVRAFEKPIPYKGMLGFFDVPAAIVAEQMR